jgi:hypothetical protein
MPQPGSEAATHQYAFQGGCRCGAIRYGATSKPLYAVTCHCRACQYDSGGAPAHGFVLAGAALVITAGTPRSYETQAASGNTIRRSFCPACGTPISGGSVGFDRVIVKAGSLDDPELFRAEASIWTAEAPSWHQIDPGIPHFPRDPPGSAASG